MKKYDRPSYCISFDLLRYIRDCQPNETKLLDWLGAVQQARYHVLRKTNLLVVEAGRVKLSPQHCSQEGKTFQLNHNTFYDIDEENYRH